MLDLEILCILFFGTLLHEAPAAVQGSSEQQHVICSVTQPFEVCASQLHLGDPDLAATLEFSAGLYHLGCSGPCLQLKHRQRLTVIGQDAVVLESLSPNSFLAASGTSMVTIASLQIVNYTSRSSSLIKVMEAASLTLSAVKVRNASAPAGSVLHFR